MVLTSTSWFSPCIIACLWNFGDGVTDTITDPVHVYTSTGVFSVALTAFTDSQQATITKTNYITSSESVPLTSVVTTSIDYTYDPLYRLVEADYSSGEQFAYAYDAVGTAPFQTRTITSTSGHDLHLRCRQIG